MTAKKTRETYTEQIVIRITPTQRRWLELFRKRSGARGDGEVIRGLLDEARARKATA